MGKFILDKKNYILLQYMTKSSSSRLQSKINCIVTHFHFVFISIVVSIGLTIYIMSAAVAGMGLKNIIQDHLILKVKYN